MWWLVEEVMAEVVRRFLRVLCVRVVGRREALAMTSCRAAMMEREKARGEGGLRR